MDLTLLTKVLSSSLKLALLIHQDTCLQFSGS